MSAFAGIVLQKSLNAERGFFRLKPKQARTANKGDSRSITEVTGEFSARLSDPPHPYMKNAPMAQKFCDQGRKTTFATQSQVKRTLTNRRSRSVAHEIDAHSLNCRPATNEEISAQ
jgi:hypothetical protein